MSSQNQGSFTYVGIQLKQSDLGIEMNQEDYTRAIKPVDLSGIRKGKEDALNSNEKQLYQSLLGKINWLAHQSRPDLAFYAYTFSLCSQSPTFENLKKLNKVITMIV